MKGIKLSMKQKIIQFVCSFSLSVLLLSGFSLSAFGLAEYAGTPNAKAALLMEACSGNVLYEMNADQAMSPASVTKIMTALIVFETIEAGKIQLSDVVTVSDHASNMGGSQVFLKAGEEMTVDELIKCVLVSSANDAAVALAEYIGGSEESFVKMMNNRAHELGATNAVFYNATGLDDNEVNLMSARDVAIISRELISHKDVFKYTTIWMDTIRNGAFGLTNTNRLIRFYKGANGLKTGSTSKAGFCITATALRDDMQLIAVIMGSPTRDIRNSEAKSLFDFGFANFAVLNAPAEYLEEIPVHSGVQNTCKVITESFNTVLDKGKLQNVEKSIEIPEALPAPVKAGQNIGTISYRLDNEVIGTVPIRAAESIERIGFFGLFSKLFRHALLI